MILRRISLVFAKYLAILLCSFTILLTTPWGTQLTLALLNNVEGLSIDYKSGSLVRNVELHSFHYRKDRLDIAIKGLSTELNFSCVSKRTLCIKSLTADDFSLTLTPNEQLTKVIDTPSDLLFKMPFSIEADAVLLKNNYLRINNTEISIQQFSSVLSIHKSTFQFEETSATQLTVMIDATENTKQTSRVTSSINSATNVENTAINHAFSTLPEINLPIELLIGQLTIDDIVVGKINNDGEKENQWHSSKNQLGGTWLRTDVDIRHFQTSTKSFAITQFAGNAKLKSPYELNTQFETRLNEVETWPEIANSSQQVSLKGSFEDLIFDITSTGSLELNTKGNINLVHPDMAFNIDTEAQKLPLPLSLKKHAAPSSMSISFQGDLHKQSIQLSSLLNSYGYTNTEVKLVAYHQEGHVTIDKLLLNDKKTDSQLSLKGDMTILPDDFGWHLAAQSSGVTLPQINLHDFSTLLNKSDSIKELNSALPETINGRLKGNITSQGKWSAEQWNIAISETEILGDINNEAINIQGDIGINHTGHLDEGQLAIEVSNSKLTLLTSGESFWNIKGELSIKEVNQWVKEINGDLNSKFSVTGNESNPEIHLNTYMNNLQWKNGNTQALKLDINYQPMNKHKIQLSLNNEHLKVVNNDKDFTVKGASFTVIGNAEKHHVNAKWFGDTTGDIVLSGNWDNDFTLWQSSIEQSIFSYRDIILHNKEVFTLHFDIPHQQAVVGDHCWLGKGLSICLPKQTTIGDTGDVLVALNLDLATIDESIIPDTIEIDSKIKGTINAKWSAQQRLEANAKLTLSPGYLKVIDDLNEHQISQWSKGVFTLTLDEQQLSNKLLLNNQEGKALILINSTLGLIDGTSFDDSSVNAQVIVNQFSLLPFQSILAQVVNLQGDLSTNIDVKGTVKSPLINGDISLDNGKLRLTQNANTLNDITSTINIKHNKAVLKGRFLIENKEANLTGTASWKNGLTANLDLFSDSLPLVFPPQLMMDISPKLNLSLIDKSLFITGNVDVLNGSYNIEKLPEGSVSVSDDVIIVDQQGKAIVKDTTGLDIKTDIQVNVAKAFEVSGQGIKTHLFGSLQVSQKERQPLQLFGKIQAHDGTFNAYGQKLIIDKGDFTFDGPITNPHLNIRASRDIKAEDIEVGIQVTGLANALDMKLFSTPTMEISEVLSYLVRGRGLDTGTGSGTTAASLLVGFGVTSSAGLIKEIERIPLINNITVDTEGTGDQTQATVSGYVGSRIYLKYGIGVYEPINELTVRMFMFNRFWLEVVSGIEQSTDLYYSFDLE